MIAGKFRASGAQGQFFLNLRIFLGFFGIKTLQLREKYDKLKRAIQAAGEIFLRAFLYEKKNMKELPNE